MEPTERKRNRKRIHDPEVCRVINALGGTGAVAALCEVEDAAVSNWKSEGIPKARLQFLKLARPEVFAEIERQSEAA